MLFPFILLAVSSLRFMHTQSTNTASMTFPDDLKTWCPHSRFCQSDMAAGVSSAPPSGLHDNKDSVHCCDDCSCSPDCGLTRTCCRSEFDRYKLDETLGTICKSLNNRGQTHMPDVMYRIVDKCPDRDQSCRSVNVSTWGSYSPVYSPSTGKIYYNTNCALCHNQSDVLIFKPVLASARVADRLSQTLNNALNGIEEDMYLEFLIPRGVDASKEICDTFMIRDCIKPTRYQARFRDLCTSFNATYHTMSRTYQNVYCYLCGRDPLPSEEEWLDKNVMCPEKTHERMMGANSLVVLLDDRVIESYERSISGQEGTKYACLVGGNSTETCRRVYCPEGYFRVGGDCRLFGENWYIRRAVVYVNLTLPDDIDPLLVSDLIELNSQSQEDTPNQGAFLQRPGLHDWKMELYYTACHNNTDVRSIIATLYMAVPSIVKAGKLLGEIHRLIRTTWVLRTRERSLELKAAFNKFTRYMIYQGFNEINGLRSVSGSVFIPPAISLGSLEEFRIVALSNELMTHDLSDAVYITKLFFCDQIDLHVSEFKRVSMVEVYLFKNGKRLGGGEFLVPNQDSDDIRVCLSDIVDDVSKASINSSHGVFVAFGQIIVLGLLGI